MFSDVVCCRDWGRPNQWIDWVRLGETLRWVKCDSVKEYIKVETILAVFVINLVKIIFETFLKDSDFLKKMRDFLLELLLEVGRAYVPFHCTCFPLNSLQIRAGNSETTTKWSTRLDTCC